MGGKPVPRSGLRGPVVRKAAVAGAVGAGVVFFGLPALGTLAPTPRTVSYVCTPTAGDVVSPELLVTLVGGPASVTASQPVTLTWLSSQSNDTSKQIKAAAQIPVTEKIVMTGELVITGPSPNATATVTATATGAPLTAEIPVGSPIPFPTVTATVTPDVAGTMVAKAGKFTLRVGPEAGGGVTYTCMVGTTGDHTVPAEVSVIVSPSASSSPSPSPSPSPSASSSPTPSPTPTPRQTRTVYVTETATPSQTATDKSKGQVTHTPGGGVSTGGGGEVGPDARVLILTGAGLMLAAATGGLVLRARRRTVRH
ncbi:hypothetical protein ACQP1K_04325 [Sphaerimonospora sp. CA-214678]|uniref:hypothetical protein n=1 Tax=Sphaerimonospora sp. CA-214678 TaxID=3240029 RepID=UPI003D94A17F